MWEKSLFEDKPQRHGPNFNITVMTEKLWRILYDKIKIEKRMKTTGMEIYSSFKNEHELENMKTDKLGKKKKKKKKHHPNACARL